MSIESLGAPIPTRVTGVLRQLHADRVSATTSTCSGRPSAPAWPSSTSGGSRCPNGYRAPARSAPEDRDGPPRPLAALVPCHKDLIAENYLHDGERLWLVDYEYSGNNCPDVRTPHHRAGAGARDEARIRELCAAYFGEATAALHARMRLQMIMFDVGWTRRPPIEAAIPTIDYDFYGWAEERWARAQAAIDGPDFEAWLRRGQLRRAPR